MVKHKHKTNDVILNYGTGCVKNIRYCIRRNYPFYNWFSTPKSGFPSWKWFQINTVHFAKQIAGVLFYERSVDVDDQTLKPCFNKFSTLHMPFTRPCRQKDNKCMDGHDHWRGGGLGGVHGGGDESEPQTQTRNDQQALLQVQVSLCT